ncbi:MAG: EI24 domain-containing protein [Microcystaceae cyanobacterium]
MTQSNLLGKLGGVTGLGYPFLALRYFCQYPQLWAYMILPLGINISLGLGLYWQSFRVVKPWLQNWLLTVRESWHQGMTVLPSYLQGLELLAQGVLSLIEMIIWILAAILLGFVLAQVGVLIGSPWYGRLSEKVEALQLGKLTIKEVGLGTEIWRSLLFEIKKLVILIGIGLPGLALNLLPGIGTLMATILGLSLTITLTCLDFLDAPLERRRLRFRGKIAMILKSLPASAGFGFTCLLLVSIPLVNLVTIPFCVTAGTLFFGDRLYPRYFAVQESQPFNAGE